MRPTHRRRATATGALIATAALLAVGFQTGTSAAAQPAAPTAAKAAKADPGALPKSLSPAQRAELAPADARRLGVTSGDEVEVAAGGQRVLATVALRQAMQPGSVFLVAGTAENNPSALTNGVPRTVEITKTGEGGDRVDPSTAVSAASGAGAETPPT